MNKNIKKQIEDAELLPSLKAEYRRLFRDGDDENLAILNGDALSMLKGLPNVPEYSLWTYIALLK